jgi:hypothetical protein
MSERKAIGYFRISGSAGALMRAELETQRIALRKHAASEGLRVVAECVDYENGKRAGRPQLAKALGLCRGHDALLVIPAVGGLAKDPTFYIELHKANVDFTALDRPDLTRATLLSLGQAAFRGDTRRRAPATQAG